MLNEIIFAGPLKKSSFLLSILNFFRLISGWVERGGEERGVKLFTWLRVLNNVDVLFAASIP